MFGSIYNFSYCQQRALAVPQLPFRLNDRFKHWPRRNDVQPLRNLIHLPVKKKRDWCVMRHCIFKKETMIQKKRR
ncbi:hypothetical protein CHUAL_008759 [Chamberlinius hualienensis]